jgi:Recombinase
MARRRQRRRDEKQRRHASRPVAIPSAHDLKSTDRVERLAYTRKQAAEALGISLATLDRRVVPAIESVRTEWGSRLIPVAELERYVADRREEARRAHRLATRPGRRPGLPAEVVRRIRSDHANGETLGEIARRLNAEGVPTSQGGRQWWPSTVRAVLVRSSPPDSAQRG